MAEKRLQVLNRDMIKYIAMFTMLLNHVAHIFLERGTPLYEIFEDIGFFTAPVMCYFLVEGYGYTRSKVKYGLRFLMFAAVSQGPFYLAFGYQNLNMIYTLLCCFLILVVMEKVSNPFLCRGLLVLLILATVNGDWPVVAPILTILLANDWGDRRMMTRDFCLTYLLFAVLNVQSYMNGEPGDWTLYAVTHALLSGLGILAAAVTTLVLYNGKRAKRGKAFSKWFFYVFYPAHLFILYLIKIGLHNI